MNECTGATDAILAFVKNKAIERQYHTYFDWERSNANKFFSLFGTGFKDFMIARVKESKELAASIEAFLELGNIRNQLVHQNFAVFPLDKTAGRFISYTRQASLFVTAFPQNLSEYCAIKRDGENDET